MFIRSISYRDFFYTVLFLLFVFFAVKDIGPVITDKSSQWDFNAYYYAAKAYEQGLMPYDVRIVSAAAHQDFIYPYVYPPVTLNFFRIFTRMDYSQAYYFYFILKCLCLAGLICLWRNVFLRKTDFIFYIVCIFAFNSAIKRDLFAGNISIFEQCMIWAAFYFYLRRRLLLFCLFIGLAALFKIQIIVFLGLILFIPIPVRPRACSWMNGFLGSVFRFTRVSGIPEWFRRLRGYSRGPLDVPGKYMYLGVSGLLYFFILGIDYFLHPRLFMGFLANASGAFSAEYEAGVVNPSIVPFLRESFCRLAEYSHFGFFRFVPVFYFLLVFFILWLSYRYILLTRIVKQEERDKLLIFFSCIVFCLISPRFKDYAYILLIVPAYFIIQQRNSKYSYWLLSFFLMIPDTSMRIKQCVVIGFIAFLMLAKFRYIKPGFLVFGFVLLFWTAWEEIAGQYFFFWEYYPFILAFFLWGLYLKEIKALYKENILTAEAQDATDKKRTSIRSYPFGERTV